MRIKIFKSVFAIALSAALVCASVPFAAAAEVKNGVKMLAAEGFKSVLDYSNGSRLALDGVPESSGNAVEYSVFFKGEEVLNVSSTVRESFGVGAGAKEYFSADFELAESRSCFVAGLTQENINTLQDAIIESYSSGEPLDIEDIDFIDAEKTNAEDGDDYLCWAAQAANVLNYTGWAAQAGQETCDETFEYFIDSFTNDGAYSDTAYCWYLNGVLGTHWSYMDGAAEVKKFENGGLFPQYPYDKQFETVDFTLGDSFGEGMHRVLNALRGGWGVGFGVQFYEDSIPYGGHALTCWGAVENKNYGEDDDERYEALILSDSDSDMSEGGRTGAPSIYSLQRVEEKNGGSMGRIFVMPDYMSDEPTVDAMITDFIMLRPFSEAVAETDPNAKLSKKDFKDYVAYALLAENNSDPQQYNEPVAADTEVFISPLLANASDIDIDDTIFYTLKITDSSGKTVFETKDSARFEAEQYELAAPDQAVSLGKLAAGVYNVELEFDPYRTETEAYYVNNRLETTLTVTQLSYDFSAKGIAAKFNNEDPDYPEADFNCIGFEDCIDDLEYAELYVSGFENGEWSEQMSMLWEEDENGLPAHSDDLPFLDNNLVRFTLRFKVKGNPVMSVSSETYCFMNFALGDSNLDGTVNVADVTCIQKHIAKLLALDGDAALCADANRDGRIDVKDVTAVQKHTAKLIELEW